MMLSNFVNHPYMKIFNQTEDAIVTILFCLSMGNCVTDT
jgi:hypothetical protein